jgi:cell division protein FtsI (penicillin-binding protein 3)
MNRPANPNPAQTSPRFPLEAWRSRVALSGILLGMAALSLWAIKLQLLDNDFLQSKGDARYSRLLEIPAPRGKIYDRNGVVLASNVPARAIWVIPEDVRMTSAQESKLAGLLNIPVAEIRKKVAKDDKRFVYLKRQVSQDVSDQIKALKIPGVYSQKEVKRDYPQAEVFANLTGFTNIEGQGQEGLELVYDKEIQGQAGKRKVLKDRLGNVIEDEGVMQEARPGKDVYLSLDARVQYIVYTALRDAVKFHNAKSASAIVVDTRTGEILALENYPSYDPNSRANMDIDALRNRAVTDIFEPGSTLKPFTIALALEKGKVTPQTMIETGSGKLQIGDAMISDSHPNGSLTVQQVIQKSSNIGTSKISFMLTPQDMWGMFDSVGFGQQYKIGFPGVAAGLLRPYKNWQKIEQATMSYGHGIAMSLLQLTHAYTVFARDGELIDLTLIKKDNADAVGGARIFSARTVQDMRTMMHMATEPGGTAPKAQVVGYTVAGKTGTAYKVEGNGYNKNKYVATFAGLAPVGQPRIVVAVMVDDPSANGHFGGVVAAPVFSQIVSETLRTLLVTPDAPYKTSINHTATEESM